MLPHPILFPPLSHLSYSHCQYISLTRHNTSISTDGVIHWMLLPALCFGWRHFALFLFGSWLRYYECGIHVQYRPWVHVSGKTLTRHVITLNESNSTFVHKSCLCAGNLHVNNTLLSWVLTCTLCVPLQLTCEYMRVTCRCCSAYSWVVLYVHTCTLCMQQYCQLYYFIVFIAHNLHIMYIDMT